jgi:hypothetical protein
MALDQPSQEQRVGFRQQVRLLAHNSVLQKLAVSMMRLMQFTNF